MPHFAWLKVNMFSWHGIGWQAMTERDRLNDKHTTQWALAWVVSIVAVSVLSNFTILSGASIWALRVVPLLLGVQFVRSYLKLVRETDELLRQVQIEALAVGFGAGLISGMTVMYLSPPSPAWALAILVPMTFGYLVRVFWAAGSDDKGGE